jgi:hypothetical protein
VVEYVDRISAYFHFIGIKEAHMADGDYPVDYEEKCPDFENEYYEPDFSVDYPDYPLKSGRDSFSWKEMSYNRYKQSSWNWAYYKYSCSEW